MSILRQMFRARDKDEEVTQDREEVLDPVCPHTSMTPRWHAPEDMGKADVARYVCDSCGETFSHEQSRGFMHKAPELRPEE